MEMELTTLSTAISTVGFPIVTTIGLFWYINTTCKELSEAIKNNTLVITRLLEQRDEK